MHFSNCVSVQDASRTSHFASPLQRANLPPWLKLDSTLPYVVGPV